MRFGAWLLLLSLSLSASGCTRGSCRSACRQAGKCDDVREDFDENECFERCEEGRLRADAQKCQKEYNAVVGCEDPCDRQASFEMCADDYEKLVACENDETE